VGAVATAAGGYATNVLTGGGAAWWWPVLGISLVIIVAAGLWGYRVQTSSNVGAAPPAEPPLAQTAGDGGANVNISARNHSVAAWSIDTLNMGDSKGVEN
jgi:hypothetical protein